MAAPLYFQLHMKAANEGLDEPDIDDVSNPLDLFIAKRTLAHAAGESRPGVSALQKIGATAKYAPPDIEATNPWLVKHETVHSQPVESEFDMPIDDADEHTLEKRIGESTRRTNLTEYIRRQLAIGETVKSLAKFAEAHDSETARLILEIGDEL